MSNSSLISYTKISPNRTSPRTHEIDIITIHCYVGQASVESMGDWFAKNEAKASCNYGIGTDGRIALIVDEGDRSWCSSNGENDHRAITIECASDSEDPYAINDKVYDSLIKLCADICQRNGIKELKWKADKSLIGKPEEQNMTVHRWFANKACPGDYIYNRLDQITEEVNALLGVITESGSSGLTAKDLTGTEAEKIAIVAPIYQECQKDTGMLASVGLAQFCLESGYGTTDLAQNANNMHGMKCSLSGNDWAGSTWDGTSKYTKETKEQDAGGKEYAVTADFRKYASIRESVYDRAAYFKGAKNGSTLRYPGISEITDVTEQIKLIKAGGYATDVNYVSKLTNLIERYDLTQYDLLSEADSEEEAQSWYRVRTSWANVKSQIGAFHNLDKAKVLADESVGYSVYDENGTVLYVGKMKTFQAYRVKVNISNLNIRTGPGTGYATVGAYTGIGVFTITEEADGTGASKWGKLQSGAGWISLDYTEKL